MNVYAIDPLADARWEPFVGSHPRGSVFHSRGWLDALKKTYGYSPLAFTTSPPDIPLTNAIVACEIRSRLAGCRLVSVPFADHCEPLDDHSSSLDAILPELARGIAARRWRSVELRPLTATLSDDAGFGSGSEFCFHSVNLQLSPDELFNRFHKDSIQRKIRRADRDGVRIESGRSDKQLEEFYRLLVPTRRRHHVPPQPMAWFRNLADCLGERMTVAVAVHGGRAIAALVLLRHGNTLVYKYGASDASAHNVGAVPFLFWHAIRDATTDGACTLDLGRTDLDNPGLLTFKDRLGGERSPLRYVSCPPRAATRAHTGWPAAMARHIVARMPDRLFVATGRLVYRYFG